MATGPSVLDASEMPEKRGVCLRAEVVLSKVLAPGVRNFPLDLTAVDLSSKTLPIGGGPGSATAVGRPGHRCGVLRQK